MVFIPALGCLHQTWRLPLADLDEELGTGQTDDHQERIGRGVMGTDLE
jgi:hypothetical protein